MGLKQAIESRDWHAVVAYLKERHDVNLDADVLSEHVGKNLDRFGAGGIPSDPWSDSTWDMWLRKKVDELKAWPVSVSEDSLTDITITVLHVFFPFLEETLDMQRLLTHEPKEMASSVARSKIGSTNGVIHPIDATAQRVAPEPR